MVFCGKTASNITFIVFSTSWIRKLLVASYCASAGRTLDEQAVLYKSCFAPAHTELLIQCCYVHCVRFRQLLTCYGFLVRAAHSVSAGCTLKAHPIAAWKKEKGRKKVKCADPKSNAHFKSDARSFVLKAFKKQQNIHRGSSLPVQRKNQHRGDGGGKCGRWNRWAV